MAHKLRSLLLLKNSSRRLFSTSNIIRSPSSSLIQSQPPIILDEVNNDPTEMIEVQDQTQVTQASNIEMMKTALIQKTESLRNLEQRYDNLQQMSEFSHDTLMDYQPRYIQLGSTYFVHKNQQEQGLKLVHQIHYKSIKEFVHGVKEDEYEFYDRYPNAKEVVIIGSANSGKSSLINALNMGTKIAHSAKTSGKTQALMFYKAQTPRGKMGMVVDTPGYGYVFAPIHLKAKWKNMVFKYLGFGVRINLIVLCVNGNIGLKTNDIQMLEDLQHFKKPVQVILTKIDKIKNQGELIRITTDTSRQIMKYRKFVNPEIQLTCADHFFGIKELRARIAIAFEENIKIL